MSRETPSARSDPAELRDEYLRWLARTGRAPSTKDSYGGRVGLFVRWLEAHPDQYAGAFEDPDVRNYAVRDWRRELIGARQAPATVALKMAAVGDFFSWAGVGRPNVPRDEQQDNEAKALDRDQIRAVLRAARRRGPRDCAVVNTLFYTASRVGEVCKINLEDVWIGGRGGQVQLIGKGEKRRTIDLNPPAREVLQSYLDERARRYGRRPDDPLFFTREGKRITIGMTEYVVKKTGTAAGLVEEGAKESWLHPHILRHTWATLYLQGGGDARTAQVILGHRDLRTTAKYTTPSGGRRREAVESVVIDL